MTWQEDPTLAEWLMNIDAMQAGDFLRTIALAAMRADPINYDLIRPTLLKLQAKYPQYNGTPVGLVDVTEQDIETSRAFIGIPKKDGNSG